jgi:hypothetical protein
MMLASRQASLGTMRMGKMRQASGTAGRKWTSSVATG